MKADVSILVWFSLCLKKKNQWVRSIFDSRSSHFQALNTTSQQCPRALIWKREFPCFTASGRNHCGYEMLFNLSNTVLLEASSNAETLKMVSLIKGGNEEREATSEDCRLTLLSKKCVKREGSLKWVLMHKLQGVLQPQSYKRQWKEKNPTQKMLGFNCLCITETLWYFLRDEKGMGTLMSREEGCSEEKTLFSLLLHVQNKSSSHRKKNQMSQWLCGFNSEVFVLWFSNCKKRQTMQFTCWKQKNVDR